MGKCKNMQTARRIRSRTHTLMHTHTHAHTSPQRTKVNLCAPRADARHLLPPLPLLFALGRQEEYQPLLFRLHIHKHAHFSSSMCAPAKCVDTVNKVCAYIDGMRACVFERQAAGRGCFSQRRRYLTPMAMRLTAVVPPNCITLPGDWLTPAGLICLAVLR